MYQIEKEAFGTFLMQLRKEKGLTQKDLAEQLYVSDKAVSKWERGLSLPDISLLVPMAELLQVTVTELLEGRRMEPAPMEAAQVEELVKKALTLTGEEQQAMSTGEKKRILIFGAAVLLVVAQWFLGFILQGYPGMGEESLNVLEGLAIGFGIYFWIFAKDRLPDYYDQNRISAYSHGPVRMNIPGITFNNHNWPHILSFLRFWTVITMVTVPLVSILLTWITLPDEWSLWLARGIMIAYLGWMMGGIYHSGKKYEN